MSRVENLRNKKSSGVAVHERTREEKEPTIRGKFFFVIVVILLGALVYLIFFSKIFNLREVNVEGYNNEKLIEDITWEVAEESLISNNLLFINNKSIESISLGDPRIRSVEIKKVYPNKINISIEESTPEIIWISKGENYLVDSGGYVISKNKDNNLVEVFDGSNIEVSLGERVASPTFINYIKTLYGNFAKTTGVKVVKITIFDTMSDVHVLSSDGWTVYLDTTKDPLSQLKNLTRVLDEASSEKKKIEYIDMRLESRIYYK